MSNPSKAKQQSKEEQQWEDLCNRVLDEVGRCITHLQIGLFSSTKAEALHAKVLQFLAKRVTLTDTNSIALSLRNDGLFLLINPEYFLNTLQSTQERTAALRHEENHLFLMHPFREVNYAAQIQNNRLEHNVDLTWDVDLFRICAYFEAQQFISGHTPISDA